MDIQSGKLYVNKTAKYLFPVVMNLYPEIFKLTLGVKLVAMGIGDNNIEKSKGKICMLYSLDMSDDKKSAASRVLFSLQIQKVRKLNVFITDYVYDVQEDTHFHMIVIEVPSGVNLKAFTKGIYSKMVDYKILERVFTPGKYLEIKRILTKDSEQLVPFVQEINAIFGTSVTVEEMEGAEYDLPPYLPEEIFNYKI